MISSGLKQGPYILERRGAHGGKTSGIRVGRVQTREGAQECRYNYLYPRGREPRELDTRLIISPLYVHYWRKDGEIDQITTTLGVDSKSIERWEHNYESHGSVNPQPLCGVIIDC
jgi:hypothetical protein